MPPRALYVGLHAPARQSNAGAETHPFLIRTAPRSVCRPALRACGPMALGLLLSHRAQARLAGCACIKRMKQFCTLLFLAVSARAQVLHVRLDPKQTKIGFTLGDV